MEHKLTAKESVSYLRGYVDGINPKDEQQKKLYEALLNALDAITSELCNQEEILIDMDESIEELYEAIDDLEEECYGDDDDDDDMDFLETECPHCGETIFFDADMIEEDALMCPLCNEEIELFDEDEELEF